MHDISQKTQIACLRADIEEIIRERDKAEAEAQALREEVAARRARVVVIPDAKAARVILDDGSPGGLFSSVAAAEEWASIWNSDSRNTARVYPMVRVDELAHLNGMTVSESALDKLRKAASGEVKHLNNGLCPDDIEGHEARDPDCPVCRALIETGKESDNV
ncbi:hypothetical protein ISH39_03220 [Pseudomonas aeruginosa]|nr:hypothetical protein [Pseudomonas aeruginosa]